MNTTDSKNAFYGMSSEATVTSGRFWLAESTPGSLGTIILSVQSGNSAPLLLGIQTLSVDTFIEIQEGAITSGGSSVNFRNPNFNIITTPDIVLSGGVVIDTPGTVVWDAEILGAIGQGNTPNSTQLAAGFFILKPNTNYAMTVTNNDTATDYIIDIGYIED